MNQKIMASLHTVSPASGIRVDIAALFYLVAITIASTANLVVVVDIID